MTKTLFDHNYQKREWKSLNDTDPDILIACHHIAASADIAAAKTIVSTQWKQQPSLHMMCGITLFCTHLL